MLLKTVFVGLFGLHVVSAAPSSRGLVRREDTLTATVINGTYQGTYHSGYNQDFFLGIPYAQPPLGDLRFTVPQSLNTSWNNTRDADAYSPICVGYGTDSIWYPNSEDCLTLNVIRSGNVTADDSLPVGVWIHGGGFSQGSSWDQRYNLSFIVQNADTIGKPFIGVSLNYRLNTWGFLDSDQIRASGNTNLGLRDQRLALQWINENIAAFGGDPSKVTIWGQSAGASSVGYQLAAYGGRDDGLFRGAIQESGGIQGSSPNNSTSHNRSYNLLVSRTNCSDSLDTLQCLREVPFETLNSIINGTDSASFKFRPFIDGDFVKQAGSVALEKGEFVKVPLIQGSNTDEGTSFGPGGINTTDQFYKYLTDGAVGYTLPSDSANEILDLYPDIPSEGIPVYLGDERVLSQGYQWRRTSAYAGDFQQHSGRRAQCQAWSNYGVPAYCYRFNVHANDVPYINGSCHFEEIGFVFNNLDGVGYHYGTPFNNTPSSYKDLAKLITGIWAAFIVDGSPNGGIPSTLNLNWPAYVTNDTRNLMVFDANVTSYLEDDTWREEQISYINSMNALLLR